MSQEEMKEELEWEAQQEENQSDSSDWCWNTFGDGDPHGWTQSEIDDYEDWLMSDDPAIRPDGSYVD